MLSRTVPEKRNGSCGTMPDLPAVLGQVEAADVAPVDQELAALELVEARDQPGDAALARAGVPHQRHASRAGRMSSEKSGSTTLARPV